MREIAAPFDDTQDKPFDDTQDKPFDATQDKPFDATQDKQGTWLKGPTADSLLLKPPRLASAATLARE